jgi:1,4-dihydroxy-2-naphthoate polyprenyltransferase
LYGNNKIMDKCSPSANASPGAFGIFMGCGLAWFYGAIDATVSVLAIVTATLIQVFSNFANDYGDSQKGTDNQFRLGPTRTVQSGEISQKRWKPE